MAFAYLVLNLGVAALVYAATRRYVRTSRKWWVVLGGLLLLTLVFDSIIIGLGIVEYHENSILGIRLGLAPIEDFFYTIAAALLIPALWKLTNKKERS